MRGPPRAVGRLVELDAEPGGARADPRADLGRALADPGGEHEGVEPAERRGERAELAADPLDEQIDRLRGARVVAGQQRRACRC